MDQLLQTILDQLLYLTVILGGEGMPNHHYWMFRQTQSPRPELRCHTESLGDNGYRRLVSLFRFDAIVETPRCA
ncbi:MAG: hypothetical protein A3F74_26135 [Betaproteobacteria bacterium RIFCSPLOWO2_12_FULL_62_58]|nr:MAG: hypothetical protein A3F74_26135 [Betaproteobacteria bacterium RIFCSPLOWO2_12_FULL_62_58]